MAHRRGGWGASGWTKWGTPDYGGTKMVDWDGRGAGLLWRPYWTGPADALGRVGSTDRAMPWRKWEV